MVNLNIVEHLCKTDLIRQNFNLEKIYLTCLTKRFCARLLKLKAVN